MMMKYKIVLILLCLAIETHSFPSEKLQKDKEPQMKGKIDNLQDAPKYLFKVLSLEDWKASQEQTFVRLTEADKDFIHLATEDQLDRIIEKYWRGVPQFVVLKIDAAMLPGHLVFESNPGGVNRYYHLYEGAIPLQAVLERGFPDVKFSRENCDVENEFTPNYSL